MLDCGWVSIVWSGDPINDGLVRSVRFNATGIYLPGQG